MTQISDFPQLFQFYYVPELLDDFPGPCGGGMRLASHTRPASLEAEYRSNRRTSRIIGRIRYTDASVSQALELYNHFFPGM